MTDFVAIAEAVVTDFYITSFGVKADFTPASLVELDAFLDETWGPTGKIKEDPAWNPTQGQSGAIVAYGSYCGEVIRRTFGGQWNLDTGKNVVEAGVRLPGGWQVMPISKAFKRLRNGREDALHPLYIFAREKCGVPKLDELATYREHADGFAARSHIPDEAKREVIARLRSHIPAQVTAPGDTAGLAPGTKLAACPKCQRAAVSGKPACVYCGAALVVPATCGKCQRKNAPTAKSCMYCRAPLISA